METTPETKIEVIAGALHIQNGLDGSGNTFNGTFAPGVITYVKFAPGFDAEDPSLMNIFYGEHQPQEIQVRDLDHFNRIETALFHNVESVTTHDSYGLTSNTGGDFYILGNTNGTVSCLIALRFADRICLDTSDDDQFYVHVEIGPKVDRFKTTRAQWENLIGTLKISMVRYNLDAEEPGTVGG